jgi:hypothetical protein
MITELLTQIPKENPALNRQAGNPSKSFKFQISIGLPPEDAWKLQSKPMAETLSAVCSSYLRGLNCHEGANVVVIIEEQPQTKGPLL